jgi:hypothetical protein
MPLSLNIITARAPMPPTTTALTTLPARALTGWHMPCSWCWLVLSIVSFYRPPASSYSIVSSSRSLRVFSAGCSIHVTRRRLHVILIFFREKQRAAASGKLQYAAHGHGSLPRSAKASPQIAAAVAAEDKNTPENTPGNERSRARHF